MGIESEKYASLTTFKRDGTGVATPIWVAALGDGRLGIVTAESAWKVKRVRNDPRVTLQPCNQRGVVTEGTEPVSGTAEVVTGPEAEPVRAVIKAKYGWQVTMIGIINRVMRRPPSAAGLIVTLDEG